MNYCWRRGCEVNVVEHVISSIRTLQYVADTCGVSQAEWFTAFIVINVRSRSGAFILCSLHIYGCASGNNTNCPARVCLV